MREERKQNNILTKNLPLQIVFNNLKELFDLIISKISSDGGDIQRIIEIALFLYKICLIN